MKNKAKPPFERVFSLVDRKRILNQLIQSGAKIYLRLGPSQYLPFRTERVLTNGDLLGAIGPHRSVSQKTIIGLFYSEKDRYFLQTTMIVNKLGVTLKSSNHFYKLNRRQAFRTPVPEQTHLRMEVFNSPGRPKLPVFQVIEFSSGGAQLTSQKKADVKVGEIFVGTLSQGQKKELALKFVVKRWIDSERFAIQFIHVDAVTANRLRLLSIYLQK